MPSDADSSTPSTAASSFPVDRRQFLVFGGLSVSLAAVLVACSKDEDDAIPVSGSVAKPVTLTQPPVNNVVYLRTSSSVLCNAVDSYQTLLDLDVLSAEDAAVVELARSNHADQISQISELTQSEGGVPFEEPNPAITTGIVEPALAELDDSGNDPQDVLRYVNAFETLIGATLQGFTPLLTEPPPRELLMRIAAAANRYSAVVTSHIEDFTVFSQELLDQAAATAALETTTSAATTTTVAGAAAAPLTPLPVAQVPSSFASLAAVEVVLGDEEFTWQTPGPNSYIYEDVAEDDEAAAADEEQQVETEATG